MGLAPGNGGHATDQSTTSWCFMRVVFVHFLSLIIRVPAFLHHLARFRSCWPLQLTRKNLNIARTPVPIFMKLGKYIMPHAAISTAYIINPFHQ
jgi:hypothetical protein